MNITKEIQVYPSLNAGCDALDSTVMRATPVFILAVCFALAGLSLRVHAEEFDTASEKLIEQLRSDDFDQRQHAARALEERGEPARRVLQRALTDDDADVRSMAAKVLAKLSRGSLRLHVADFEGAALANAEGTLVIQAHDTTVANVPSHESPLKLDAKGNAEVKLETLGSISYQVKLPGFVDEGENGRMWTVTRPGVNPVNVTLCRGGTLSGSLLDTDGKPIKDASITIYSEMRFDADLVELQIVLYSQMAAGPLAVNAAVAGNGRIAQADEDGKWELKNVPQGVYTCIAQAPGHFSTIGGVVRLRENSTTTVPAIAMKPRNAGKIELKFKQADGAALAKTSVAYYVTSVLTPEQKTRLSVFYQTTPLHSDSVETDENGLVTIEDLSPGKYMLSASTETDPDKGPSGVLIQTEVEVKPGETVRPEPGRLTAKSGKAGSIKGRILSAAGKGVKNVGILLETEQEFLAQVTGIDVHPHSANMNEMRTDGKGVYRFENVAPGKYVLAFGTLDRFHTDPEGYVFGVVVENDKQTLAPETVFNNAASQAKAVTIEGRVFQPDGKPAGNAQVNCFSNRQCETVSTQPDGTFTTIIPGANLSKGEAPKDHVVIKYADCKPLLVEGPFTPRREFRLEKQDYGSLRVAVTDENGKPLAGVKVAPSSGTGNGNPFAGMQQQNVAITNLKGVARLNGLATGARELAATLRGYYIPPHQGDVKIVANTETDFKLVLHSGERVAARVKLPDGFSSEDVIANLDNTDDQSVGANGEVVFEGVAPGPHVFSANAPGLLIRGAFRFTLPQKTEKTVELKECVVELVKRHGLALDCGKKYAGCSAQLDPIETIPAPNGQQETIGSFTGSVDASGRAEFDSLPPGKYYVMVVEMDSTIPSYDVSRVTVHPTAGPFEAKPIGKLGDVAKMEAVKAKLIGGTGQVTGHLQIHGIAYSYDENVSANIALQITGAQARANATLTDPLPAYLHPADPLILVGTLPEGFKPRVPGSFEIENLPAGEYTIFAVFSDGNSDDEAGASSGSQPTEIAKFTIKDGEKLNLGEVKFELRDDEGRKKSADDYLKKYLRPDDKAQEFEP